MATSNNRFAPVTAGVTLLFVLLHPQGSGAAEGPRTFTTFDPYGEIDRDPVTDERIQTHTPAYCPSLALIVRATVFREKNYFFVTKVTMLD